VNARELGSVAAVFAVVPEAPPPDEPVAVPGDGGFAGVGVPLPPVIVAVSSVSDELLVHVMGTFVLPMATVKFSGLALVNWGCVTVIDVCWPAVMVPLCVPPTTSAALLG
jgi:hypothetical protein